ncbi:hypothetical protein [Aeromonas veronii]|uniref:hypothetical protein n=1 Tax=Aeromonas veronii TaxID=654 RepID=UPI000A783471|nr:hypothetical protein [Aeromonas veronii]
MISPWSRAKACRGLYPPDGWAGLWRYRQHQPDDVEPLAKLFRGQILPYLR